MSDQFVAIPTMIKGRFRMVEDGQSPRLCSTGPGHAGNAVLREEILANTRQNEVMVRFLIEMDKKLDSILGLLQRESLAADFPLEGRIVRLSGSGLILECQRPLKPGEHMELLLLMEELSVGLLSVIAHVEEELPGKALSGTSSKAYAMTYTCMNEADREAIIRFVFSENRKLIRQQKNSEEA